MEKSKYKYWLEVHLDGNLYAVTEYENGMITKWEVNTTIEVDELIYFISI